MVIHGGSNDLARMPKLKPENLAKTVLWPWLAGWSRFMVFAKLWFTHVYREGRACLSRRRNSRLSEWNITENYISLLGAHLMFSAVLSRGLFVKVTVTNRGHLSNGATMKFTQISRPGRRGSWSSCVAACALRLEPLGIMRSSLRSPPLCKNWAIPQLSSSRIDCEH